MFVFELCVQTTMSGPHGSMLITLEVVETMSSWTQFAFTTVPECVRTPGQSKLEPLNGSQPVKLERRSMQTPLWASGASIRSRVLIKTAPTTQFASSVPKVQFCNTFKSHSFTKSYSQHKSNAIHSVLYLKSLTFDFAGDMHGNKNEPL